MQTSDELEVTQRVREIIDELKARRGYTKKRVCDLLGIGQSTLDDYLNGKSSFKLDTLIKLSQISRLSLSEIVEGTKDYDRQLHETSNLKLKQLIRKGMELSFIVLLGFMIGANFLLLVISLLVVFNFLSRNEPHGQLFSGFILILTVFELGLTMPFERYIYGQYSTFIQNSTIFSIHLLMDIITFVCIRNYQTISLLILYRKPLKERLVYFNTSSILGPLLFTYLIFCLTDTIALAENLIRHLDKIGISDSFAARFSHWTFWFNHYPEIKTTLVCFVLFLLYSNLMLHRSSKTISLS
ncbi:helix-turn-helix domain-containing protein [Pseudoalteromonas xiamenensis]|uniref:helix-turn-helix domain-containing protein n=1 Tax=Pseudoalteromonas xiamenensis TaxID=882626 RepID=UPI0035EEC95B